MYKWRIIVYLKDGRILTGAIKNDTGESNYIVDVMFGGNNETFKVMNNVDFDKIIGYRLGDVSAFEIAVMK